MQRIAAKHLLPFLLRMDKRSHPESYWAVPEDQHIWLQKILIKIKGLQYTKAADLLEDFELLHTNCKAVSTRGGKTQQNVTVAERMVDFCKAAIEQRQAELMAAEQAIEAAVQAGTLPPCTGEAERVTPCGFQRVIRPTPQHHSIHYKFIPSCASRAHKGLAMPSLQDVRQLTVFLQQHAACRLDWAQYAKQPEESALGYELRLGHTFSFGKLAALLDPYVQVDTSGLHQGVAKQPQPPPPRQPLTAHARQQLAQRGQRRKAVPGSSQQQHLQRRTTNAHASVTRQQALHCSGSCWGCSKT
ncbi:hypothetical protein WJX73_003806 [Symbiochloris irregularis]|uniref:Bromo domain-containing protein n=1 Tax=Symbiochloris irregularis TaxID=706552 RepID=A0AAW1PX67_9CHLO